VLILSLIHSLFATELVGTVYVVAFHIVFGVAWVYLQAVMLVHPLPWVNGVMAGFASAYLWMGLCLAIAQGS